MIPAAIAAAILLAAAAQRWPRPVMLATVWTLCRVAVVALYGAAILGTALAYLGEALEAIGREFAHWSREGARALSTPPPEPVQESSPARLSTDAGSGLESTARTDPRLEPAGRPSGEQLGTLEWYVWSAGRGEQDTKGVFDAYSAAYQHQGVRHVGRSTFFNRVKRHRSACHAWAAAHGDLGAPIVVVRDRTGESDGIAIV